MLTPSLASGIVFVHTVTTKHKYMRTKTLLIAAAALVAGVISSNAQVYSANVVGYSKTATANGGTFLLAVPFTVGVSNGANEIWPIVAGVPTLPDFSSVLIWSPGTLSYTTYQSDSGSASGWDDAGGNPLPGAPTLPVGQGFFLIPSGDITNTFAGSVAVNIGTSNSVFLANGGTYLVAPSVPYSGAITNGNPTTKVGGVGLSSLNGLPDFSSLLIWNPGTLSYTTYQSDSGSASLWDDAGGNPLPAPPTVSVGQGFFIIPSGDFTWKVGL
jgi:hypothetical protein